MSKIQNDTIKLLKANGYLTIKIIRLGVAGYPDIMAMKENCKNIWIEIKEDGDTLKPLQAFKIDELNKYGNIAFCLHKSKGVIYPESDEYKNIYKKIKNISL